MRHRPRHLPPSRLLASLVLAAALLVAPAGPVVGQVAVVYRPPVPGEVLRDYQAPEHDYAAGHRGVDLGVAPGEPVRTAAPGTVAFAGPIAGQVWVTVVHADGLRTSYGELTDLRVRTGTAVPAGAILGLATGEHRSTLAVPDAGLHWSARRGERYLDPLALLDQPPPRASLVGPGGWWGSDPVVTPYAPYAPGRWFAGDSPQADRPGFALPPNHHHAVLVGGFATPGPHDLFAPDHLGYGPLDTSRFSYAGCTPHAEGCDPLPYEGRDTHVEVAQAAAALREHLRGRQRAQPWRPVDLLGHSMGGDVVTYYVEHLHDPHDPRLPPIGSVVTYGTPHRGSAVARVGRALSDSLVGTAVGEGALWLARTAGVDGADGVALDAPAVRRYGTWLRPPSRAPERVDELGVAFHAFAGSRDLVVSPGRAAPRGTAATVLPGSHGGMLRSEAVLEATHAALSGAPVTGADGHLVGVGPALVDRQLRGVATVIDGAELLLKGRLVRQGLAGARRLATGEQRLDASPDPPDAATGDLRPRCATGPHSGPHPGSQLGPHPGPRRWTPGHRCG